MRKVRDFVWILLVGLMISANSFAQDLHSLMLSPQSKMKVEGTSSLHDWHCEVELKQNSIGFSEVNGQLVPQELNLEIPVKNMNSGKRMMNKLMYKSMKEKDHPFINYLLKEVKVSDECPSDKLARLITIGELEIAGAKKQVKMTVDMVKNVKGEYCLQGSKEIKMSDFGIEPPKAMFGTVTTGDVITVSFDLKVAPII